VEALMRDHGAQSYDDAVALAAYCELTTYSGLQPSQIIPPN
jgi:hypothetical protein